MTPAAVYEADASIVVPARRYGKSLHRHANREAFAAQFAFIARNPQSGLAEDWDNDLEVLLTRYLGLRWTGFKEEAAACRARAVCATHKGPAKFEVRMEPTDRWGLPTSASEAYAPALVLAAGDMACAFVTITGASLMQVEAALGAALVGLKQGA